jgi:hypothetical protein
MIHFRYLTVNRPFIPIEPALAGRQARFIGGGHFRGFHSLIFVNLSSLFSSDDPHEVAVPPGAWLSTRSGSLKVDVHVSSRQNNRASRIKVSQGANAHSIGQFFGRRPLA